MEKAKKIRSYIGKNILGIIGIVALVVLSLGFMAGLVECFGASIPGLGGLVTGYSKEVVDAAGGGGACKLAMANGLLSLTAMLLGMAGNLCNFFIETFIIKISLLVGYGTDIGKVIAQAWTIVRDLGNIALIAGLVWTSISMILSIGGQHGKTIANIIIVALLVNFSYFFAGVIIDASNIVSRDIYQTAINPPTITAADGSTVQGGFVDTFMIVTRLSTVYDANNPGSAFTVRVKTQDFGGTILDNQIFIIGILGGILFAVAAAVFFVTGLLFILRAITIIMLLILSPFGVLGFTGLGSLKNWGDQWWKTLMAQAIFPVAFFVLMAIAYKIMGSLPGFLTSPTASFSTLGSALTGDSSAIASILGLLTVYILSIGLMIAALTTAWNVSQEMEVSLPSSGTIFKPVTGGISKLRGLAFQTAGKIPTGAGKAALGAGKAYLGLAGRTLNIPIVKDIRKQVREDMKSPAQRAADQQRQQGNQIQADILLNDARMKRAKATARDKDGNATGTPADVEASNKANELLGKTIKNMSEKELIEYLEHKPQSDRDLILAQMPDGADDSPERHKKDHVKEHLKGHKAPKEKSGEPAGVKRSELLHTSLEKNDAAGIVHALDGLEVTAKKQLMAEYLDRKKEHLESLKETRIDEKIDADLRNIKAALGGHNFGAALPESVVRSEGIVKHVDDDTYHGIIKGGVSGDALATLNRNLTAAGKGAIISFHANSTLSGMFDGA